MSEIELMVAIDTCLGRHEKALKALFFISLLQFILIVILLRKVIFA